MTAELVRAMALIQSAAAELAAMQQANAQRARGGYVYAYDEDDFMRLSQRMDVLAQEIIQCQ